MEDMNILDIENEIHMFCLHHIYLPRMNHSLYQYMETWNREPPFTCASSMRNLSLIQLWISGLSRTLINEDVIMDEVNLLIKTVIHCITCHYICMWALLSMELIGMGHFLMKKISSELKWLTQLTHFKKVTLMNYSVLSTHLKPVTVWEWIYT